MVTVPPSSRSHSSRITANPQIVSAIMLAALAVLLASLLTSRGSLNATLASQTATPAAADLHQMPLAFIPNAGQTDPQVYYQTQSMGGTLFFTHDAIVLSLPVSDTNAIVRMQFVGSAAQPTLLHGTQLPGVANLIEGSQPAQWHTNLPTYNGLTYDALYDGISLHYDGINGQLKSTYFVAAQADATQISWRYTGIQNASVDAISGDLHLSIPGAQAPLIERAPIAWQEQNGQRIPVPVGYDLRTDGSIGFALGAYNTAMPLTIDPTLEYSTFIGGSGADRINAIAIDPVTGDIFVTGETSSTPFPGSPTNIGTTGPGSFPNVFVARLKADGSGTVYRTVIGGTNSDKGLAIAVTTGGIANIAGYSFSNNFPTTATAVSPTYNNNGDAVAFALDATGALDYSTYLGGTSLDVGYSIAAAGTNLYIAGSTDGTVPGQSSGPAGGTDAIVYKIDKAIPGLPGQLYAHRLGGLFNDTARAIALDNSLNVYVTGSTASDNTTFPIVTPLQANNAGGSDLFISQLNAAGTLVYSSFLGGTDTDEAFGITVDPAGNVVYLTGRTLSPAFPGAVGVPIGQDAFVTKVNIATNTIDYSRYLGSPGVDAGNAIALEPSGAVYVAGSTSSVDFYSQNPLTEMASNGGNVDGFITRFDASGNPSYSSRIGGASDDVATGVATLQTPQGTKVYVSGYTNSGNFPMTIPPTTIQPTIGGSDDGFIVRIANARPQVDLNDANTLNGIDFGPVTWTEAGGAIVGSGPVAIANQSGLSVLDSDSATLAYAEVRFVASGAPTGPAIIPADGASESLSVTLSGGITGSYSAGVLHLTAGGASTLANFQNVLRSITYNNTSQNPTAGQRLIAVEVNDGIDSNIPFAFSTINVVATNDPPVVTVPGAVSLNEEATTGISGVSVADVDAGSAPIKVTLSVPASAGSLAATGSGAATVTPAAGASLVIVGTQAEINATLATLSFTGALDVNTNSGGADSPITLTVLADDQGNTPAPAKTDQKTVSITINPLNDAPVVPVLPAAVTTAEDTAKTISIVSDLGLSDAKDTSAPAAAGAAAFPPVQSITVTSGPSNGTIALASINRTNGTFIYTPNLNYSGADTFDIQVCDSGTPGSACASQTVNVTITPVNDPPVVTLSGPTLSYTENSAPIAVDAAPGVADSDTLNFNGGSLTASITTAHDSGDTLTLVDGGNITLVGTSVNYSGSPIGTLSGGTNGTALTISFTSATVTPAVAAEIIQQLRYNNTSDAFIQGSTTAKVITISVNDGASAPNTGNATRNLNVIGVNDAPVLDNTGTMVLSSISENSNRNNGTLVSAILASAGGSRITDLDSGAAQGIAVIAADTSNGIWQFSTNAGTTWTAFGSLTPTSSTLLIPSARVRFLPNVNFNGLVDPGITFVAWDQTSGANGATGVDSTPGGGTSAFSGSTESASISVVGVNQAPVLDNSGIMTLDSIAEDIPVAANNGTLVSTILASAGGSRITDADTGALQGLAITGIDSSNGSWQFSIDGGANWTAISSPADGRAVLLASDGQSRVRFLPNADYSGTVDPAITFRAWDQTSSANGATLVDVSVNGDPSAFSTATETASIVVTSVNDNPVANDDTFNIPKNSANISLDVLANDSILPDTGETLAITAIGVAQHGSATVAPGGAAVLYQPNTNYNGPDSFSYTISDGNGGTASATVHIQVGLFYASLPLVLGEPIPADLEITNFTITPAGPNYLASDKVVISVTVHNNGTLPTGGFYTELYINPSVALTRAGILWNTVCSLDPCYGITWYVQQGLAGGQSVTLTSTNYAPSTRWLGSFAPGTSEVYVYVDSWNGPNDPAGFIKERDETNNLAVIRGLNVASSGPSAQTTALPASEQALTTNRDVRRDQPLR